MKLLLEDDLVEAVVHLYAAGGCPGVPVLQIRRFHTERESCYKVLDSDDRAAAFARVQLSWFNEWGVEKLLASVVSRFPVLNEALAALAFRKARGRADEGAELYCDAQGQRRGIVALQPDRFGEDVALACWLHHELAHVADMVDERFGYSPDLAQTGQTASQHRLVCERYRLLWDVSIDGRLIRRGLGSIADEAQRRREFDCGFAFLPDARRAELFAGLWSGRTASHTGLLELAADPRGLQDHHAPVPGAPCPLCGFAAFQWIDANRLCPAARERIRVEFPGWRDGEAVCARCAEIYDAVTGQEYPATVCL